MSHKRPVRRSKSQSLSESETSTNSGPPQYRQSTPTHEITLGGSEVPPLLKLQVDASQRTAISLPNTTLPSTSQATSSSSDPTLGSSTMTARDADISPDDDDSSTSHSQPNLERSLSPEPTSRPSTPTGQMSVSVAPTAGGSSSVSGMATPTGPSVAHSRNQSQTQTQNHTHLTATIFTTTPVRPGGGPGGLMSTPAPKIPTPKIPPSKSLPGLFFPPTPQHEIKVTRESLVGKRFNSTGNIEKGKRRATFAFPSPRTPDKAVAAPKGEPETTFHAILESLDRRILGLEEVLAQLKAERENLAGAVPSRGEPSGSNHRAKELRDVWLLEEECIR